jgi:hypothetical protein
MSEKTKVSYLPPARRQLEQLAKAVCERLAATDGSFKFPEIRHGLADFLSVITSVYAKQLNQREES